MRNTLTQRLTRTFGAIVAAFLLLGLMGGAKAQTLSIAPASLTFASGGVNKFTIRFTGTGTHWTSTPPTFTLNGISGGAISAVTVTSDTTAFGTIQGGSTYASQSGNVADSTTSATATFTMVPPSYLQVIDGPNIIERQQACTNPVSSTSNNTANTFRIQYATIQDTTKIRLVYCNWYNAAGTGEVTSGAITVKASITSAGAYLNNQTTPIWFSGVRTGNIASGGNLISDPLPIALAAGQSFWVTTYVTGTNLTKLWSYKQAGPGMDFASGSYNDGSDHTDNAVPPTNNGLFVYGPSFVISPGATPDAVAFLGDSIGAGATDFNATNGVTGALGKAFANALYAPIDLTAPGETATTFTNSALSGGRRALLNGVKAVVCEYGMNDLRSNRTTAQIKADLTSIYSSCRSYGVSEIYGITIDPYTTSTDGWLTLAGQTPALTTPSIRPIVNDWLRSNSGGLTNGYIEWADLTESGRNSNLWSIPSTPLLTGTVAAATTTTISDSALNLPLIIVSGGANIALPYYGQCTVKITGGTGSGQIRSVQTYAINQITVSSAWTTVPDTTSTYAVYQSYTPDGIHPFAAAHTQILATLSPLKILQLRGKVVTPPQPSPGSQLSRSR